MSSHVGVAVSVSVTVAVTVTVSVVTVAFSVQLFFCKPASADQATTTCPKLW